MKRFEKFEHTSDIGFKVYGRTIKGLFKNAGLVLAETISDFKKIEPKLEKEIFLKADSYDGLLMGFLGEILNFFNIEEFLTKEISIKKLEEFNLRAVLKGEKFDKSKHVLNAEVKGITYHRFKIKKLKDIYSTDIIFDV